MGQKDGGCCHGPGHIVLDGDPAPPPAKGAKHCCAPFAGGWFSVYHYVAWAEVYFLTKWRLHPSSRLATIDMGQKLRGCTPFRGELRPHITQRRLGRCLPPVPSGTLIHQAVWAQRTLAENWGLCPFRGGGTGSPSNTVSPRRRPTSVPSGILIHTAVWPQ